MFCLTQWKQYNNTATMIESKTITSAFTLWRKYSFNIQHAAWGHIRRICRVGKEQTKLAYIWKYYFFSFLITWNRMLNLHFGSGLAETVHSSNISTVIYNTWNFGWKWPGDLNVDPKLLRYWHFSWKLPINI